MISRIFYFLKSFVSSHFLSQIPSNPNKVKSKPKLWLIKSSSVLWNLVFSFEPRKKCIEFEKCRVLSWNYYMKQFWFHATCAKNEEDKMIFLFQTQIIVLKLSYKTLKTAVWKSRKNWRKIRKIQKNSKK